MLDLNRKRVYNVICIAFELRQISANLFISEHGDYMSNFKKTLFGGYKRSEVDAAVIEFNKKLEEYDTDRKRLQRRTQNAESRIEDFEKKLSELSAENKRLSSDRAQNEMIFNDIAKIYKRAYGAGREIVCDSKETAQRLLNDIGVRFDEMMGETQGIIDEYETIHRDMGRIFETLSRDIRGVEQTASHMLERAKAFAGMYGQMKSTIDSAQKNTDRLLREYDVQASEFMSRDYSAPSDDMNRGTERVPEYTGTVLPESEPELTSPTVVDADITVEENTENNKPDGTDFDVAYFFGQTEEKAEDAVHTGEYAAQVPSDIDSEVKPDAKLVPNADESEDKQSAGEFTQFGRKSRISAQDRSELLRKALLKNGVN